MRANAVVKAWLYAKQNYLEIILKLSQCFASHVTTDAGYVKYDTKIISGLFQNKTTFIKQTRSLSNAACFKYDSNVCALGHFKQISKNPEVKVRACAKIAPGCATERTCSCSRQSECTCQI